MGLLHAYATYKYGKKKGEKKYAEAIQAAAFAAKERKVEAAREETCVACGWEKYRHGPMAECPVYPEMEM